MTGTILEKWGELCEAGTLGGVGFESGSTDLGQKANLCKFEHFLGMGGVIVKASTGASL
jgi:hypothetical protein